MNSEELEQSLRTEFESYLKDVLADMKQEISDFQTKIAGEVEKHKTQLDEVFGDFSARFDNEKLLDPAFKDSIIEHLRLSRDEGARITATAIAEAEEMQKNADEQKAAEAVQPANYSELRDAVRDISEKDSQSAILKALVGHAAQFTPRGAFFIIKNEHFVGWRVFGKEGETEEQIVREVFFPVSSDTVLGESVRSLSPVETTGGTYTEDSLFLNKLEFGHPETMIAIPLVARQRGVAVLYADHGSENEKANIEALETLVRVAGMTVELLAAQPAKTRQDIDENAESPAKPEAEQVETVAETAIDSSAENNFAHNEKSMPDEFSPAVHQSQDVEETPEPDSFVSTDESSAEEESLADSKLPEKSEKEFTEPQSYYTPMPTFETIQPESEIEIEDINGSAVEDYKESGSDYSSESSTAQAESVYEKEFAFEPSTNYEVPGASESSVAPVSDFDFSKYETEKFPAESSLTEDKPADFETNEFQSAQFETNEFQSPQFETSFNNTHTQEISSPQFETPAFESNDSFAANKFESNYESFAAPVEIPAPPVEETSAPAATKSRLSERNVDLPIEVSEEERRPHNDARRFARLLVSEIKLYNEQKVKEGREAGDLYDRLREAIDRSREMYDKRVQSPVAAKFDYFHYELVNNLAEGSETKLGGSYPGAVA